MRMVDNDKITTMNDVLDFKAIHLENITKVKYISIFKNKNGILPLNLLTENTTKVQIYIKKYTSKSQWAKTSRSK